MTGAAAAAFEPPRSIRAMPEPRLGGKLRQNAPCGVSPASQALGQRIRAFSWLHADPGSGVAGRVADLLAGQCKAPVPEAPAVSSATAGGARIAEAIRSRRIARTGERPAGFGTCVCEAGAERVPTGVEADALELDGQFEPARTMRDRVTSRLRARARDCLTGLDTHVAGELDRSLRPKRAMDRLRNETGHDAFAVRCRPEALAEHGGAACTPAALLDEGGAPCAGEAHVHGALTQRALQEAARAPAFLSGLVDIDTGGNTDVIQPCGQAPCSMRDPAFRAEAAVRTNRGQPPLRRFPLKPGPVTCTRFSQAFDMLQMVPETGEMLRRPFASSGTSGVIRFSRDAGDVLRDVMPGGLEHHVAFACGDHRPTRRGVAGASGLPHKEL